MPCGNVNRGACQVTFVCRGLEGSAKVGASPSRGGLVRTLFSLIVALGLLAPGLSSAQSSSAAPPARDPNLPAGEENAKEALNTSPRHGEMVNVPLAGGPGQPEL